MHFQKLRVKEGEVRRAGEKSGKMQEYSKEEASNSVLS